MPAGAPPVVSCPWAASASGRRVTQPGPSGHHAEVWRVAAEWGWIVLDAGGRTVVGGIEGSASAACAMAERHLRVVARRFETGLDRA